jgi:hypothetical protein
MISFKISPQVIKPDHINYINDGLINLIVNGNSQSYRFITDNEEVFALSKSNKESGLLFLDECKNLKIEINDINNIKYLLKPLMMDYLAVYTHSLWVFQPHPDYIDNCDGYIIYSEEGCVSDGYSNIDPQKESSGEIEPAKMNSINLWESVAELRLATEIEILSLKRDGNKTIRKPII